MASILGKDFPTHPITTKVAECPTCIFFFSVAVSLVMAISSLLFSPSIVAGIDNFVPDESQSKQDEDTVAGIRQLWSDSLRTSSNVNISSSTTLQATKAGSIYVIYYLKEGQTSTTNLLTDRALDYIRSLNKKIISIPSYGTESCWRPSEAYTPCVPLNSVLQYFYPGEVVSRGTSTSMSFTGVGGTNSFESALELLFNNNAYGWFLDRTADASTKSAIAMRQGLSLGTPISTSSGQGSIPGRVAEKYARDVRAIADSIDDPSISAVVGGYKVFDSIVSDALKGDLVWVFVSCVAVFIAFRIHMHSIMLALFGCVQMLCLFPMSLLLYGISKSEVSLLLALSYYVSMLVNCCAQMITFDAFKHSGMIPTSGHKNNLTVAQRTAYVFRRAGSGVAAASICGVVCFLVSFVLSKIEAVREFSEMMLIVIAINFLLQLTYTPSMILVHHYYFSNRRRNQQKQRELFESSSARTRPKAQIRFHEDINAIFSSNGYPTYSTMVENMKESQRGEVSERKANKGIAWRLNLKPYISKVTARLKEKEPATPANSDPTGFEDADEHGVVRDDTAHIFSQSAAKAVRIKNANAENIHSAEGESLVQIVAGMGVIESASKDALSDFQLKAGVVPANGDSGSVEAAFVGKLLAHQLESHGWAVNVPAPKEARIMKEAKPPPKDRMSLFRRLTEAVYSRFRTDRRFIFIGPRVNETAEERRLRVMRLPVKEEGFNRMERGLMNGFVPVLNRLRYAVLIVMGVFLLIGVLCAAFLTVDANVPSFLPPGNELDRFTSKEALFSISGSCDYCAPYFTYSYAVNTSARETCYNQLGYYSLSAEVNVCGSCRGDVSCLPCSSVPGYNVDSCSQCLLAGDVRADSCLRCTPNEEGMWQATGCGPCALGGMSGGGPSCASTCGSCSSGTSCSELLGTCICASCAPNSSCSNRGTVYASGEIHPSLVGTCICNGQSFGPSCSYCRCYNGGTCQSDGSCKCLGDWTGPDCSQCSTTCRRNGRCPLQFNHSHYSYFQCRDLFCSPSEVVNFTTVTASCSLCELGRTVSGCSPATRTCAVDSYNTTTPSPLCHSCRNYFEGADCDTCGAPAGLSCDINGEAIGCDGGRAISGQFKTLDSCGVCGGDNACIGCNPSLPGLSYDLCGVCGGSNDCFKDAPSTIEVMWPIDPADILQSLRGVALNCTNLQNSTLVLPNPTACSISAFTDSYTGEPDTYNVSHALYIHARDKGYIESVIFSSPLAVAASLRVEYFIATFRSSSVSDDSANSKISVMKWNVRSMLEGSNAVAWSSAWVAADIRDAISEDTSVILAVAFVATLAVIGAYSVSFRITVAAFVILALTLLWSVGTVKMLGRSLSPVDMVVILFAYSMEVSCLMYMAEGYVEQLHFTQSHLLAEHTTRIQNVKGMLRRTGVPVLFSSGLVFVASLLLLGPKLVIFNVIGKFMSILSVCTALFAVCGFSAVLLIIGPAKSHRRPLFMLASAVLGLCCVAIVAVIALFATRRIS